MPQDALKQAVFDKPKVSANHRVVEEQPSTTQVAKKVFQMWDKDNDKKLSWQEFSEGFSEMCEDNPDITIAAIRALWQQTDTNLDGYVSWDEFRIRFCVDEKANYFLRQELAPLPPQIKMVSNAYTHTHTHTQ